MFVIGEGKYNRQSSSADSYGHVVLKIEPTDLLEELPIRWEVPFDQIPAEFRNAITESIEECLSEWGEHYSQRFLITISGGSYHEVDSHNRAFGIASSFAIKDALDKQIAAWPPMRL